MNVQEFLPSWVPWLGPAFYVAGAALWILLVPALPVRRIRRRLRGVQAWPERAAIAWEARIVLALGLFAWLPIAYGQDALFLGPYSVPDGRILGAAFAIAAVVTAMHQSWRFSKFDLAQPIPDFPTHAKRSLRRWWPLLVFLAVMAAAPARLTSPWMIPWILVAAVTLLGTRYLAEAWILSGVATPADERLQQAVARAARRVGVEPPRSFVLDTHGANALALPVRNLVIFTSRTVEILDDDELESIALHEIAHLNEGRRMTRLRTVGLFAYLPLMAIKPLIGAGWVAVVIALLAVFLVGRVLRRTAAHEEARADHTAVEASHESRSLGTALLRLHQAALVPTNVKGDPHGPLHERLLRAGVEPDFEPVETRNRLRGVWAAVAIYFVFVVGTFYPVSRSVDIWDGATGTNVALSFGWRTDDVLWYAGESAAREGDYAKAAIYLEEAVAKGSYEAAAALPWVLGSAGRCDEVAAAYEALVAVADPIVEDVRLAQRWAAYCAELK